MTRRDPSAWESSVRRPDDFDEYWRQTEAETLAVPLNPAAGAYADALHTRSRGL